MRFYFSTSSVTLAEGVSYAKSLKNVKNVSNAGDSANDVLKNLDNFDDTAKGLDNQQKLLTDGGRSEQKLLPEGSGSTGGSTKPDFYVAPDGTTYTANDYISGGNKGGKTSISLPEYDGFR